MRILIIIVLMCMVSLTLPLKGTEVPRNLLFFGNSFTMVNTVHNRVGQIAVADGNAEPLIVADLYAGKDLDYHIQQVLDYPQNNVLKSLAVGDTWDAVVIQGYSTEATRYRPAENNPFEEDVWALYQAVEGHSSQKGQGAVAVLYQTWARPDMVPSRFDSMQEMQDEIAGGYDSARLYIETNNVGEACVAPVGRSFEAGGWNECLYGSDRYHASVNGSTLSALVLYRTIYDEQVGDIPYEQVSSWVGLSEAEWNQAIQWADEVVVVPYTGKPGVRITSPLCDELYHTNSPVLFAADAVDNSSVDEVRFYVDGQLIHTAQHPPYQAIWSSSLTGSFTFKAVAVDDEGNTDDESVMIEVVEHMPPVIDVLLPELESIQPDNENFPIHAEVSSDGIITNVELYVDNMLVESKVEPPYNFFLQFSEFGKSSFYLRAYNDFGQVSSSRVHTVTWVDGNVEKAINCGGVESFVDENHVCYTADTNYIGGNASLKQYDIPQTDDDPLYLNYRWGAFGYDIPLSNACYEVTFKFVEPYFYRVDSRVFNINMEGAKCFENIDIYSLKGKFAPLHLKTDVEVFDGELNIVFTPSINNAVISAIEIRKIVPKATLVVVACRNKPYLLKKMF